MISKELLSEVIGIEIVETGKLVEGTLLSFRYPTHWGYRNIYELAHECKEWAREKGFFIVPIFQCKQDGHIDVVITDNEDFRNKLNELWSGNGNTELEAIFKACEWIRENQ